jgi:hypothetical protein
MKYRIRDQWDSFRSRVIPKHVGAVQRQEMRRAFYAGAAAMLDALMMGLTDGPEAEEPDLVKMEEIAKELREFTDDVKHQRA